MNKNLLKICFVIALTMCAATAYGSSAISSSISMAGGSFSPSNKVTINVASVASAYTAYSKHSAGDRVIAANNADPKMYFKTVAITAALDTPTTTDVLGGSSWTSM